MTDDNVSMIVEDKYVDTASYSPPLVHDFFVRPKGYEELTQEDVNRWYKPPPNMNRIGANDARLAVIRPHFHAFNTFDKLIANVAKYNERSVQRII